MVKAKEWFEISIKINQDIEEAVSNYLFEIGCVGCFQRENVLLSYFDKTDWNEKKFFKFTEYLKDLQKLGFFVNIESVHQKLIPDQDWNAVWRKSLKPIHVLPDLIIKPTWEQISALENAVVIDIDPQMAFGSGTHATTQLMLKLMKPEIHKYQNILDIGTGSGILAIAALKLTDCTVFAFDIDPIAVNTSQSNSVINFTTEKVHFFTGTIDCIMAEEKFDLILANVNRTVIIDILPEIKRLLKSGGQAVLSGILIAEENIIKKALKENDFKVINSQKQDEWLGLVVQI